MAQPQFINGYKALADLYIGALDTIIPAIAGTPTEDELNNQIVSYLSTTYYEGGSPTQYQLLQLRSLMPGTFNAYTGSSVSAMAYYNDQQLFFVQQLIAGLQDTTLDGLEEYISLIDESLTDSDLTPQEQAPLLMTTATLAAAIPYFKTVFGSPGSWAGFLNPIQAVNEIELPKYLNAIMQGALIGASLASETFSATAQNSIGPSSNMISVQAGALATTFGSITLKWVQRPMTVNAIQLELLRDTVNTTTRIGGGGDPAPQHPGVTNGTLCRFFKSSHGPGTRIGWCASRFINNPGGGGGTLAQAQQQLNLLR